ncbi:hypothetical protein E4T45_04128 [Aureobasidium sp. EXF-8846]|nr:hypothetical protein E4T45_04128 [Aureobasidium sp. EXF-8846]
MAASAMSGRLTLSDPSVKELAQASCVHEKYYDALPKLQGEENWQEWSDALQHAALIAGTDAVLNGELKHPKSLEGKQCTTAEWNDNIKRTAVWRSRNESLLKAMRGAADIDFSDLGALNAHDTYVELRSKYLTSDNQRAYKCFSDDIVVCFDLESSPEEIANILQHAFDQYNQLVGDNIEQLLPENFLKMAFLNSLNSDYHDWRKSLLRERDVLALGQGSTLTFKELVELAVIEHSQLLQDQSKTGTPEPAPPPPQQQQQQAPKRNISHVDESAQLGPHRLCSVPHHHYVQNPRLRQMDWKPSKDDRRYLAEHPEIEEPQLCDDSSGKSKNDSDNGSEIDSDNETDDGSESMSDSDNEGDLENAYKGGIATSASDSVGDENDQEEFERATTADGAWERFAAARFAEVQSQMDLIAQAVGGRENFGKTIRKAILERASPLGSISGKWLLYGKERISSTADYYRIQLWETTTEEQRKTHPNGQFYQGSFTIGPHGHSETFRISSFTPSRHISTRPTPIRFRQPDGRSYRGFVTFWGDGKMIVTLPPLLLDAAAGNGPFVEFAGLLTSTPTTDPQAKVGSDYDRVIRTGPGSSVPVKLEQDDSDMTVEDDDQDSTAIHIKAEGFDSDDSDDGLADDIAATMDTVQKQKDALRGGLIVPLRDLPGMWYLHSPDYKQGPGQFIRISFYDRVEHGPAERMCAPGHCKPSTDQIHYCGELRFKAKEGERDWSCLIKQFDVPKQASVASVKIQSWDPLSKRVVFITVWFLGGGAMCMSLPTTYIPNYQGQKTLITFSGVKRG